MQHDRARRGLRYGFVETLEPRRLLSAPGTLDMSFGNGGKVTTDYSPTQTQPSRVAVQSDGKIVVIGQIGQDFLISRYDANGNLDTSFGATRSGKVEIHVGANGHPSFPTNVAIAPSGKIVVAGFAGHGGDDAVIGVVQLNSDGTLDTSFGTNGQITSGDFGSSVGMAMAVQTDGKIVVAGTEEVGIISTSEDFLFERFNTNGSLDKSFGSSGQQSADFGQAVFIESIAIDYNGTASTNPRYGTIVGVGDELLDTNNEQKFALVRLKSNGSFDNTFDGDGKTSPAFSGELYADGGQVAIESDGSILVAGTDQAVDNFDLSQLIFAHYLSNGALDTSFGGKGFIFPAGFAKETSPAGIAIGFTGDIIIGVSDFTHFSVAAFTPDGVLDSAFGSGGKASVSFTGGAQISDIALAPNRHIIALGGSGTSKVDLASLFDVAPQISVNSLDPTAGPTTHKRVGKLLEPVFNPASLIVSRDLRLPFATRVFFTIGGSANVPNLSDGKRGIDGYTLSGMTVETLPATAHVAYVDIPANQTFVVVTLSPENIPVGNTTATFTINSSALYDSGSPTNQTITILGTGAPPPPPTTPITDNADAYVEDGSDAAMNFGTSTKLEVKDGGSGTNRLTYLKFDLSSVSTANSVKLTLFGELSSTDATNVITQLFSVADTTWTENGITFNNKPAAGTSVLASATIANTTPTTYTFDVTAYVKAQLAMGIKTVSFVLKNPSNSSPFVVFNSKEAGSNAPTLAIS